jgi:orotate phosphoribosyltransferase-like protein
MAHTKQTIEAVCLLRKDGYSFERIGKELGLTKNTVLALVYKHYLGINKHQYYKKAAVMDRDPRPSVPYVPGLTDTKHYVLRRV